MTHIRSKEQIDSSAADAFSISEFLQMFPVKVQIRADLLPTTVSHVSDQTDVCKNTGKMAFGNK